MCVRNVESTVTTIEYYSILNTILLVVDYANTRLVTNYLTIAKQLRYVY